MRQVLRDAIAAEAMKFADRVHELIAEELSTMLLGNSPHETKPSAPSTPPPSSSTPILRPAKLPQSTVYQTKSATTKESKPFVPSIAHLAPSEDQIEEDLALVVSTLQKHRHPIFSEQLRRLVGLDKQRFRAATNLGRDSDQLIMAGEKRGTLYALPGMPLRMEA